VSLALSHPLTAEKLLAEILAMDTDDLSLLGAGRRVDGSDEEVSCRQCFGPAGFCVPNGELAEVVACPG
jgi:hypothetical protein